MINYLCYIPVSPSIHPAAVWCGDLGYQTPDGSIIEPDNGLFRISGPRPYLVTVYNDLSWQKPCPLTIYAIETYQGSLAIIIIDPSINWPQLPFGIDYPQTPAPGYVIVPCLRPVQFIVRDYSVAPPPPPPPPPNIIADLTGANWNLWFSPNMPGAVNWAAGYPFPTVDGLHYSSYPVGNLQGVNSIHIKIEITGGDTVQHVASNDIQPCKLTPFFGLQDTTWQHLRFWCDQHITMSPGVQEITVSMDPSIWHTVDGSKDPGAFASMVSRGCNVGFTCGGQFFDGHGIYSPSGTNGMYLRDFELMG